MSVQCVNAVCVTHVLVAELIICAASKYIYFCILYSLNLEIFLLCSGQNILFHADGQNTVGGTAEGVTKGPSVFGQKKTKNKMLFNLNVMLKQSGPNVLAIM